MRYPHTLFAIPDFMQIEWRKAVGTQVAHQLGKKLRNKVGGKFLETAKNNF